MAERKRLAIKFDIGYKYSSGATIYLINIINALNNVPDIQKPEIFILYLPIAPIEDIKATQYPYLHLVPIRKLPLLYRIINRVYRNLFMTKKFNLITRKSIKIKMDAAFSLCIPCDEVLTKKQFIWYADLQTHHNPENYSAYEIKQASDNEIRNLKARYPIVLSSQWCVDDFYNIHPNYPAPVKRLRFAPTHPLFNHINISELKNKFNITRPYFIVSNQYWVHKNHIAVFKAIKMLRDKGIDVLCLCTGSPTVVSAHAKDYVDNLLSYLKEHKLESNIQFLGFIPREEQLCLLKNSISIIQPSFFESWNTTVEDAKALNKYIILSDLAIHREQMDYNCAFFNPNSPEELCQIMLNTIHMKPVIEIRDYTENIRLFGKNILEVFELI